MAEQYNGNCHLRFDDTNPSTEKLEYTEAIKTDVTWLGFKWDYLHHAADYFDQLFAYAIDLINQGKAFVCSLSMEETRQYRGTLTEPGQNSPYRERSIAENLDLFHRMQNGEFANGTHVLRAKIDMAAGNLNMRDPIMYRILNMPHQHVGTKWNVYPTYDYAHCLSDAIENITHSLCTLEFQDHRPLYDWFLEQLTPKPRPQQIEFSRLNLSHTITSKRNLKKLVESNIVAGWDDPRMSTLAGLRHRGFTPQAIRNFCQSLGISKSDSTISLDVLEECVRKDLNTNALRAMCVLKPLKVTITNFSAELVENLTAPNHPQRPELGSRIMPFTRTIYIEQNDFMENPPSDYQRLAPNKEVRLRYGYVIKCEEIIKDPTSGQVIEVKCSYDPDTLGKTPVDRKVKGVIHWVSATHAKACKVNLYSRLFQDPNPASAETWEDLVAMINPDSLTILEQCYLEPNIFPIAPETHFQFERLGYFVSDRLNSTANSDGNVVFNRVVELYGS